MQKLKVGILGATGMVGQQYVKMLSTHPFFEIGFLASSEQSAGKSYKDAVCSKWVAKGDVPSSITSMPVHHVEQIIEAKKHCRFVFSALSSEAAAIFEEKYAKSDLPVVSNASTFRKKDDIPMIIPEVNPEHLGVIKHQQKNRGFNKGFIVVKPNCSLQSYLLPLYPLHMKYGIKRLIVTTMQALSGAGHPGVSSLDIMDNIIPFISGEEEKSEIEPLKILGKIENGKIKSCENISISAHCNRVPVIDGHMACISVEFDRKPLEKEILETWKTFKGKPQSLNLPSAPSPVIIYKEENNRPQPRLDREEGNSMAITVGRLRPCSVLDFKFIALSHNTVRGAAGGGILNAELLYKEGYLD